jgi:hypothetical protein
MARGGVYNETGRSLPIKAHPTNVIASEARQSIVPQAGVRL